MNLMGLPSSANQGTTFRPKKRKTHPSESKLEKPIITTLGSGNLREAVKLPPGEDINEWLAYHTVDFYNQVNVLYATLKEFCTPITCPIMNAGLYEYRWADGVAIKKPITVSAPEYVEYLMNWTETLIDNEAIFPKKPGVPFPTNFKDFVKQILKRFFRVYAHIYRCHFKKIVDFKEEAHLNTCFKHFVLFISEFQLIAEAELAPLKDLVETILNP
ncbi:MOB kinase activator-like 2A [Hirschfeldia incana]|nr:MOB kinase activator-like 2A [Hirschfeldia incana]